MAKKRSAEAAALVANGFGPEAPPPTDPAGFLNQAMARAQASGAVVASSLFSQPERVLGFNLFALDWALLGTGGVPAGRIVELVGPASGGKSSAAFRVLASGQGLYPTRLGTVIGAEAGLFDQPSLLWAARQGVNLDLVPRFPEHELEDIFDRVYELVESGDYAVIVIDSIAASGPRNMMTATESGRNAALRRWGKKRAVAEEAGAITEFLKAVMAKAQRNETTLVVINQVRDVLAVGGGGGAFGSSLETTPGGHALRHAAALRLRMERVGDVTVDVGSGHDKKKLVVGALTKAKVIKSKFSPLGAETGVATKEHLRIIYANADPLDETGDVLHAAIVRGVVRQAGSWFEWADAGVKAQGEDNFIEKVQAGGRFRELRDQVVSVIQAETRRLAASGLFAAEPPPSEAEG